jgi:hypothetical protein
MITVLIFSISRSFHWAVLYLGYCAHFTLKAKAVPLHATKALGGRGGITPAHSRPRHYMGVNGQRHALPRFSPGERTPGTHCAGGWVGNRAGLDTEAKGNILSPVLEIEPRLPGRPARSQTLYWLSYPGSRTFCTTQIFTRFWSVRSNWNRIYVKCLTAVKQDFSHKG